MSKHTPGPWKFVHETDHSAYETDDVVKAGVFYIASIHRMIGVSEDDNQTSANGNLIAAAPDLLTALEESIEYSPYKGESEETPFLRRARAAIAKAKGEA